jgi:hypothetical protein
MRRLPMITALAALASPLAANAASTPPMAPQVAALQKCRAEPDASKRLACYDQAVEALTAATQSDEVVVVERAEVRKARKGLFGFTLPRIGLLAGRDGNKDDEADASRLESTIASANAMAYGRWRFEVEGGALWETTETSISFQSPKAGRAVIIEAGAMGSYMAKVGNGGWVRVKRIR